MSLTARQVAVLRIMPMPFQVGGGGWVLNLAVGEGRALHLTGSSLKSGTFEISGSTNSSVNAKNMSGINLLSLVRDIIGTA